MFLKTPDIQEFQRIWKSEFDEDISGARAETMASRLIELYAALQIHADGRNTQDNS